ncbi:MAG: multidrug effflux MFS transporter [Oleispira sp.]
MKNKFIFLVAFLMSFAALAIDMIMPALGSIKSSLGIQSDNDTQLIISIVFLGMSFGILFYGPLSDAFGRKKSLYLGISLFVMGGIVSYTSQSLEMILVGQFLQGFGAAACRVVSLAMIRDRFSGAEMGKIMSLIMMIFIIVPAIAPSLGQFVLYYYEWQTIFALLIALGVLGMVLLKFMQEETLPVENRIPFSFSNIVSGIKETLKNPISRAYALASGFIFGAFVGYLSSAQQILQIQYELGNQFAYYFGGLALFIGLSSFVNSQLIGRYGMAQLANMSLMFMTAFSALYLLVLSVSGGESSLVIFLIYLGSIFLLMGTLFGNLNALAIEPLGHIAGIANSVIGSLQTFISVGIGGAVGQLYSGDVYPLVSAFFIMSLLSLAVIRLSTANAASRLRQ